METESYEQTTHRKSAGDRGKSDPKQISLDDDDVSKGCHSGDTTAFPQQDIARYPIISLRTQELPRMKTGYPMDVLSNRLAANS